MEQVRHLHNCILFKIGDTRYLYGLTYSYIFSTRFTKYKPHFLILPSKPYTNQIFMHFAIDNILKLLDTQQPPQRDSLAYQLHHFSKFLKGIIVTSQRVFYECGYHKPSSIPIIALEDKPEDHKHIIEEKLISSHEKQIRETLLGLSNQTSQKQRAPLQLAKWLGQPIDQLKLVIGKQGNSTIICSGLELIIIDPSEDIYHILSTEIVHQKWQMLLDQDQQPSNFDISTNIGQLLNTIIITRATSIPSLLTLMLFAFKKNVYKKIKVILLNQEMEQLILETAYRFLYLKEQIIRQRFWIRILEPHFRFPLLITKNMYKENKNGQILNNTTTNLMMKFHPGAQEEYSHLIIEFGATAKVHLNKCIMFHGISSKKTQTKWENLNLQHQYDALELKQLPKNIESLQYLVIFRIQAQLQKMMKTLPVLLRKKIIYNRLEHKYNHKYFVTLEEKKASPIQSIKQNGIQIITGPRHSKKFRGGFEESLNQKEAVIDFLLSKDLIDYNFFEDMLRLGDYVTVFNNHSNFAEKTSNIPKSGSYNAMDNKVSFGSLFQNSNSSNKNINGFSQNLCLSNRWKISMISQFQRLNIKSSALFIISGIALLLFREQGQKSPSLRLLIKNQLLQIHGENSDEYSILIGIKQCIVGMMPLATFLSKNPRFKQNTKKEKQNVLQEVHNSFLDSKNISRYELGILNAIGHRETYEIGNKVNYNRNEKIFFVSKGALKWNYSQITANSGYFIGDLIGYYFEVSQNSEKHHEILKLQNEQKNLIFKNQSEEENILNEDDEQNEDKNNFHATFVEAIKDTWVVQIDINHFHNEFAKIFPHKLIQIFDKRQIFN